MKPPMNDLTKNILLWLVVAVIVVLAYQSLSPRLAGSEQQMSYSEFVQQVKNDNVSSITISANMPPVITGKLKDGSSLHTVLPAVGDNALLPLLESHRVKTTQQPGDNGFSRSEERRVGKECRARWSAETYNEQHTVTKARR